MHITKIIGISIWLIVFLLSAFANVSKTIIFIGAGAGFVMMAIGLFITMEEQDGLAEALFK